MDINKENVEKDNIIENWETEENNYGIKPLFKIGQLVDL